MGLQTGVPKADHSYRRMIVQAARKNGNKGKHRDNIKPLSQSLQPVSMERWIPNQVLYVPYASTVKDRDTQHSGHKINTKSAFLFSWECAEKETLTTVPSMGLGWAQRGHCHKIMALASTSLLPLADGMVTVFMSCMSLTGYHRSKAATNGNA